MTFSFFANFIDDQSSIKPTQTKELNLMKTEQQPDAATAVFLQTVSAAVTQLKQKLQQDYEQAYPGLGEIVRLVLDEEETKAWELSLFPHLLLPDLVEAHVARLDLQPAETKHDDVLVPHRFLETPTYQPALALCG
jgi:hypothetical protein